MANSLNFNSTDLSAYGIIVKSSSIGNFRQEYESQLIQDISYAFTPKRPPKVIRLEVAVTASDNLRATLDGYLDNIKLKIVTDAAKVLKLDTISARYWNAKLTTFEGRYRSKGLFEGVMVFQADDPMAYANTEENNDHTIDATPKTITETPSGTGYILPVWTLTPGENRTATIKLENLTTDEEMQWTGTLLSGKDLVIDTDTWYVSNDGGDSMAEVVDGSVFPRLKPGVANSIKVTALYDAVNGNLNITYRNRWL